MPYTYCERCDQGTYNYTKHTLRSSRHNICDDCDIDFSSYDGLKTHWAESTAHIYCQYCDEHFDSNREHLNHDRNEHASLFCEPCDRIFWRGGEPALHEHNRHIHDDRYCASCRRMFSSESNLRSHLRSSIHNERDIVCPMRRCGMSFVSVSAMMLHLDQGSCVSGMNRDKVNKLVVQYDRNNVITNPNRLITSGSGGTAITTTTYIVSDLAYNGRFWECYLCNSEFRRKAALNQHLNSPRHQTKIYRCPRTDCLREFTTLSGIMQHVESQSCGAHRFRAVQDVMNGLSSNMRRLAL